MTAGGENPGSCTAGGGGVWSCGTDCPDCGAAYLSSDSATPGLPERGVKTEQLAATWVLAPSRLLPVPQKVLLACIGGFCLHCLLKESSCPRQFCQLRRRLRKLRSRSPLARHQASALKRHLSRISTRIRSFCHINKFSRCETF